VTDLTATAKKIMELFNYFRIKPGDSLSQKLFLTRKHLWKDLEEQEVQDALKELIQQGYMTEIEAPSGWRLQEAGAQYLKSLKR
jgi:biotin operon repressor